MNRDDCPKPIWIDGVLFIPVVDPEILATLRTYGEMSAPDQVRAAVHLNEASRSVLFNESRVQLTRTEFAILSSLVDAEGRTVRLRDVLRNVWGSVPARGGPELLRTHIRNLRVKLSVIGVPDTAINCVRGEGYRFRYQAETDGDRSDAFLAARSA
jgi:DNA-binding response OmpR family regulator